MKKDFAGVQLDAARFDRLAAACADDPAFPRTFEEWHTLVSEGELLAATEGKLWEPMALNVDFFLQWCAHTQVLPGLQVLRAFLIIERAGAQIGLSEIARSRASPHPGGQADVLRRPQPPV